MVSLASLYTDVLERQGRILSMLIYKSVNCSSLLAYTGYVTWQTL